LTIQLKHERRNRSIQMQSWKIVSAAMALGASSLISPAPAAASPMMAVAGAERLAASEQPLQTVQYRR
jgi:hypothetical protein